MPPIVRKAAVPSKPAWWLKAVHRVKDLSQIRPGAEDFRRFGRSVVNLFGMFGAVLLWLTFGPFAIYPPVGHLDPWFYTGYFSNFSYLLLHRGFTYYVSRLPWIIPGRIAFSIAPPEIASLLLCAGIVTVSGISVYWMVRWHYGQVPAVLAVLALITNPYFMATTGWQYPDGAAIAYATVALALYLRPHGSLGWNGFLAAAALTLSAFTNMAGAPMILSLLLIPLWRWRHSREQLRTLGSRTLAGVAVTTLLLMGVSKIVLGDAWIFKPQLNQWLYALHNPDYLSNTWGHGPGFLMSAVRLFTPAFLLIFGPVLLLASREPAGPAWPVYFALLTCCSLYAFQEFALNRAGLRVPYVSSYMMVLVACFVGIVLGELWKHKQSRPVVAAIALAIFAMALPFVYNLWWPLAVPQRAWPALTCLGIAAVVSAILVRRPRPFVQNTTCALVFIAVSAGPATDVFVFSGLGDQKVFQGPKFSAGPRAASFQSEMKLQGYLKSNLDPERNLIFWWDSDEPQNYLFRSAEALYVSPHADLTKELSSGSSILNPSTDSVVHLTAYPERIAERVRLLASRRVGVENERRAQLSYAGKLFTVELQDLTSLPDPR